MLSWHGQCQQLPTRHVVDLSTDLNEISGLIHLNGKIIGHNDSGTENSLFEIDTITGQISREVVISNAINRDWEDICHDSSFIYIGDFGNNLGNRIDLTIYKVSITDFFTTPNDSIIADSILFNYSDQTDFTPSNFTTNYDCESIANYGDSLIIATKNWGNYQSCVYHIPKLPGNYTLSPQLTFNAQGLVCAAHYNPVSQTSWYCGYTFSDAFVIKIDSTSTLQRHELNMSGSIQVEGITELNNNSILISTENNNGPASLIVIDDFFLHLSHEKQNETRIFKEGQNIQINIPKEFCIMSMIDYQGRTVAHIKSNSLCIPDNIHGVFIITAFDTKTKNTYTKKLKL